MRDSMAIHNGTLGPSSARNALLDLLRIVAALLIVLYHYAGEGPWPLARLSPVFLRGYLATDFFLILSGYVLGSAYGRSVAAGLVSDGTFVLRRVIRIWPAHLVVLAAFAAVIAVAAAIGVSPKHPDRFGWSDLPAQALLVHAWGASRAAGWNLPTWSLSALVVCYAAFPTLWRKLARVSDGGWLFLGGLAALAAVDVASWRLLGRSLFDLPFEYGVIRALPLFLFGCCLARAGQCAWIAPRWRAPLAAASGAGMALLQLGARHDLASMALIGLMIAAAGGVDLRRGSARFHSWAQIAFALYITHIFTAMVWFEATRALEARIALPESLRWGLWGLSFPAALLAAALFDRWIDQPLQRRIAGWRASHRPAGGAVVAD